MKHLKDTLLLEVYFKAIALNMEKDFVEMLKQEIEQRNLDTYINDNKTLFPI